MSIFLAFEALSDSTACVVTFRLLQIVSYDYPFVDQAIRLLGVINLDNQWGEISLVRPSQPTHSLNLQIRGKFGVLFLNAFRVLLHASNWWSRTLTPCMTTGQVLFRTTALGAMDFTQPVRVSISFFPAELSMWTTRSPLLNCRTASTVWLASAAFNTQYSIRPHIEKNQY